MWGHWGAAWVEGSGWRWPLPIGRAMYHPTKAAASIMPTPSARHAPSERGWRASILIGFLERAYFLSDHSRQLLGKAIIVSPKRPNGMNTIAKPK